MGAGHTHVKTNKEHALMVALVLTGLFFIVELIGGIITESLALISDAAHMLTDVTALALSLAAIKVGRRSADNVRTFGYYRFEILAATLNTILLFLTACYVIYEAYLRLHRPSDIHTLGMLIVAALGLVINVLSMWLLRADKDKTKNLNVQSAYMEVWSDALGSVGVLVGALMMQWWGWMWVDSLIAILIGLWVLPRAWILFKTSINILLEGVPNGIDVTALKKAILMMDGVTDIHELHVWAITHDKISLTAHVVIEQDYAHDAVLSAINAYLTSTFSISHTTLQLEYNTCLNEALSCHFERL